MPTDPTAHCSQPKHVKIYEIGNKCATEIENEERAAF
jgi:hypothetical protein